MQSSFFFKANLFQEKQVTNEWKNDDCDIVPALYSVYKKTKTSFFYTYLLTYQKSHLAYYSPSVLSTSAANP